MLFMQVRGCQRPFGTRVSTVLALMGWQIIDQDNYSKALFKLLLTTRGDYKYQYKLQLGLYQCTHMSHNIFQARPDKRQKGDRTT